ncbi:unnamed protein product, partial [Aphanomyces euteiches]
GDMASRPTPRTPKASSVAVSTTCGTMLLMLTLSTPSLSSSLRSFRLKSVPTGKKSSILFMIAVSMIFGTTLLILFHPSKNRNVVSMIFGTMLLISTNKSPNQVPNVNSRCKLQLKTEIAYTLWLTLAISSLNLLQSLNRTKRLNLSARRFLMAS